MRTILPIMCCFGLLIGCAHPHYVAGHGDAGRFMLSHAIAFGGRPISTNGLPVLDGEWQYVEDKYGVGLLFPVSRYAEVESFLTSAFGPRSGSPGWAVRDIGVAIYLQREDSPRCRWYPSAEFWIERMTPNLVIDCATGFTIASD